MTSCKLVMMSLTVRTSSSSNTARPSRSACEHTTTPTSCVVAALGTVAVPIVVHWAPSRLHAPVNDDPLRVSRSQAGDGVAAGPERATDSTVPLPSASHSSRKPFSGFATSST